MYPILNVFYVISSRIVPAYSKWNRSPRKAWWELVLQVSGAKRFAKQIAKWTSLRQADGVLTAPI